MWGGEGGSKTRGISGSTQHQFVETGFGLQFLSLCFLPPVPSFLLLLLLQLSLTRCNFVVSSVPAGCDNPLLLIILNQEGLSLSPHLFCRLSPPFLSAGDRQNGEE